MAQANVWTQCRKNSTGHGGRNYLEEFDDQFPRLWVTPRFAGQQCNDNDEKWRVVVVVADFRLGFLPNCCSQCKLLSASATKVKLNVSAGTLGASDIRGILVVLMISRSALTSATAASPF